ncbi:alpha/beta fold hydrolase [Phenylobacterium sp.]|uniref:alpha/beta fold hydrolase n=1 Tax=Phenylobacterium sp. TaxID=1871053 RepID=UPI002FC8FA1F
MSAAGVKVESRTENVSIATGTITLSALQSRAVCTPPRGLILALHGGGYSSAYWDCPIGDGLSLLQLGAGLGYSVLAPDRPGYGASHGHDVSSLGLASQVEILFDVIDTWCATNGFDGPVFVIGHSIGAILALRMAAHPRGARLGGVDVLGAPLRFPASAEGAEVSALPVFGDYVPAGAAADHNRLVFGPPTTHDEDIYSYDLACRRPMPAAEYRDALAMPASWNKLLPAIRIPVRFTLAEFEVMQVTGWDALGEVRDMLSGSIDVEVHLQKNTGHNASLHRIGRAYHLRAIAFFEQSLAAGGDLAWSSSQAERP